MRGLVAGLLFGVTLFTEGRSTEGSIGINIDIHMSICIYIQL